MEFLMLVQGILDHVSPDRFCEPSKYMLEKRTLECVRFTDVRDPWNGKHPYDPAKKPKCRLGCL